MLNTIRALLADHKMINKLLKDFRLGNSRLQILSETISRVVRAHAWFEDNVFIPVLKSNELSDKKFLAEIGDEHKEIDGLMKNLRRTPVNEKNLWEARALQFKALMQSHFLKEEKHLFPFAMRILSESDLNQIGLKMQSRQAEVLRYLEG